MNEIKRCLLILISASIIFFSSLGLAEGKHHGNTVLDISNAWSPAAAPVALTRVGYLSISNLSDKTVSIVSAASPLFDRVGFHETLLVDGISSMKSMEKITIKAKQELILEPSGMHLMLMNASSDLAKATSIPLVLNLDNGQAVHFNLMVKSKNKNIAKKTTMKHSGHAHH